MQDDNAPASPPSWLAEPSIPSLKLPPGSCDAHFHIFGPRSRFAFAPVRDYTPSDAPKEMLFALHDRLGIARGVVVQPNCYGYDNSVVMDAVVAAGGTYRGIALVPVDVSDQELKQLDAAGIRGARFHFMKGRGGASPDEVIAFGKRLADIGWHLQIQMDAGRIAEVAPTLKRSACPVMIDHMGRIDASLGLDQAPFGALLALMQDENVWVKVSGIDRVTRQGPPYADAVSFPRRLVEEFGNRVVWGTDWPHTNHGGPTPDDGALVDCLAQIAPSPVQRQALLVDNSQRFYRFDAARRPV
ncbi:MAG TPA: amidohydrolase family protein [Pseudolabrys sp.]